MRVSGGLFWFLILGFLVGCTDGGNAQFVPVAAAPSSSSGGSGGGGVSAPGSQPGAQASVGLGRRGVEIDGKPVFLYGGELQYFRLRDPQGDVQKTHAMWARGLDAMKAAGMNFVTTYVPWDVHEQTPGTFDFSGVRDLDRFLEMATSRGFYVHVKPGPFINSEWPDGFGSFGAVPDWFRHQYPGALVRTSDGSPWSFHPLGFASGRQPTYLAPDYLTHVEAWFRAVAPIFKKYIGRRPGGIVALQIDNETNLFFADRYDVDYSAPALDHFRNWLRKKYGTIADLNRAWGTSFPNFARVDPPVDPPSKTASGAENLRHRDWYLAGQDYVRTYHRTLRRFWTGLGIDEPDVLFTTNDSPHLLLGIRKHLLWDADVKNDPDVGVATLDLYPKQWPTNGEIMDLPFLCEQWTKLFDEGNDRFGPGRYALSAELQGGMFDLPVGEITVPPATTDHVMLKTVGHGLTMAAFYVLHGGLNRNGSAYDFQAGIAPDGTKRPRWAVYEKWGRRVVRPHGEKLLQSEPLEDPILILYDADHQAPQGNVPDNLPYMASQEHGALYGWLANAGYDPAIRDARYVTGADLAGYDVVLYLNPGFLRAKRAKLLADYVQNGGTLVNFLHEGRWDLGFQTGGPEHRRLTDDLFPARPRNQWKWPIKSGGVEASINGQTVRLTSYWYARAFELPPTSTPFLWEKTFPFGLRGRPIGYTDTYGAGEVVFIGTYLASEYGRDEYYRMPPSQRKAKRDLARMVIGRAGVTPTVDCRETHAVAWARRIDPAAGGGIFVFVENDGDARQVTVRLRDAARLGLDPADTYRVEDVLNARATQKRTGADLLAHGVAVPMTERGTALLYIRK